MRIGVVGYSAQTFDQNVALQLIRKAFDAVAMTQDFDAGEIKVVSGLTYQGIPGMAYDEAVRRGWKTVGIACSQAFDYACFPTDETVIVGDNWGDESETFLQSIDVLVRVGGGKQSHREAGLFKQSGKPALEFELPAGVAQAAQVSQAVVNVA